MKTASAARLWIVLLGTVPLVASAWPQEPIVEEEIPGDADTRGLAELEQEAQRLFAEDDLDGAVAIYRQLAARHTDPAKKAETLVLVAWIEHLSQRRDAALDTLTGALALQPDLEFRAELFTDSFRDLFFAAQARAEEERERQAFEAVERGVERLRARDYAAARQAFEEALAVREDHPQALYNLALVELHEGHAEEALAGFQKVAAVAGGSGDESDERMRGLALTNVGYLYNRRQLYPEAKEALAEAVRLQPDNASAWLNLGVARRRLGEMEAAIEALDRAHELDPDDPGAANHLALAYIDVEDWVSAVALLKGATERHPDDANLWLNFGLAQIGLGNKEGAVESFQKAIRDDPDDAQGWAIAAAGHLASHFLEAGNYTRVLQTAERMIAWRPESSEGWAYKGVAEREMGEYQAARRSLEEARRLEGGRASTHSNLGGVYLELRLLDEAEEAYRRALAIDPELVEARQGLASVAQLRVAPAAPPPPAARASRRSRKSAPPPPPPPPPRARLGLRFADIDYSALGLKGVMVEAVTPGTLADRAALRPKDLILKVDGRDVTSPEDLERYVRDTAKKSVVLDLLRDNLPTRVEMKLE